MAKRKSEADPSGMPSIKASSIPGSSHPHKRPKPSTIEEANALEPHEFSERFIDNDSLTYESDDTLQFNIAFAFSNHVQPEDMDACFHLIEHTSRKDYESSSWGWHARRKKREMREPEMRYLIATAKSSSSPETKFKGFLSFMLTYDSTPAVPVVYIYEVHLTDEARGKGLGYHLMRLAEKTARKVGVEKVMLTCFLSNVGTRRFYERLGYVTDICSPEDRRTRNKIVKVDYVIMSKELRGEDRTDDAAKKVLEDGHGS